MVGPMTLATVNVPVNRPMYFARSVGGKRSPSTAKTEEKMDAAADPLDGAGSDELRHGLGDATGE